MLLPGGFLPVCLSGYAMISPEAWTGQDMTDAGKAASVKYIPTSGSGPGLNPDPSPQPEDTVRISSEYFLGHIHYVAGAAGLIILQSILIFWLFRLFKNQKEHRFKLIESEKALRQSESDLTAWRNRYDLIVEASGQVVYEYIVPTGNITWGKSIVRVLGYSLEEISGGINQWQDLLHPDDEAAVMEKLSNAEKNCSYWDVSYRMKHKLGHYVWIRDRGFFLPGSNGQAYRQLGMMEDISERVAAEKALRESEERNRAILNALPDIMFMFNREYVFTDFRASDQTFLLMKPEKFLGKTIFDVLSSELAELTRSNIDTVFTTGQMRVYQYSLEINAKTHFYESRMVLKSKGEVLAFVREITDFVEAEEQKNLLSMQLLQALKTESVGRLAGGVAHDFNNMLGAITGYAELALIKSGESEPLRHYLEKILKTAAHSADLTRQLLAFARQQVIDPRIMDLNTTIENMVDILRRLIGENINLEWMPGNDLWLINADSTQIEQIIINLCVNAKDAISGTGIIKIETSNTSICETRISEGESIEPGDYVTLSVSDTGTGMDHETMGKIFEPFFTTKELGHGTGLGLATVYGIVKQNKGFINVYSEPGRGSVFRIYLCRHPNGTVQYNRSDPEEIPFSRGEMILVVEDDPPLLELTRSLLEELKYSILHTGSPEEAVAIAEKYPGRIDLVLTDIIMPEMNGRELVEKIRKIRHGIKIAYMSGYTADIIAHHGVIEEKVNFIQKPFTMRELAIKIRSAIDSRWDGDNESLLST